MHIKEGDIQNVIGILNEEKFEILGRKCSS